MCSCRCQSFLAFCKSKFIPMRGDFQSWFNVARKPYACMGFLFFSMATGTTSTPFFWWTSIILWCAKMAHTLKISSTQILEESGLINYESYSSTQINMIYVHSAQIPVWSTVSARAPVSSQKREGFAQVTVFAALGAIHVALTLFLTKCAV